MMIKRKSIKIALLILLAVLPALFPFGGRDDYLFPYMPSFVDTTDGTFLPWELMFAFIWITFTWCAYGYLFARWFGKSRKWVIICNSPVVVNAILEIVYYKVMGFTSADHPNVAYWIGSHIDKINPLGHLFGIGPVIVSIAISALYYFILFGLTYRAGLKKHYPE